MFKNKSTFYIQTTPNYKKNSKIYNKSKINQQFNQQVISTKFSNKFNLKLTINSNLKNK